ncbi:MAG: serine hydrolase domain-containing protein [Gemmatimonadales bacterium]|nr:serine hydrolase domain-containing protein [Gemmatimonadales bacterium]
MTLRRMVLIVATELVAGGAIAPAPAQSPAAVAELVAAARASHSDALYLWRDGAVLIDTTFSADPTPIELMSAFKSVVALGIGRLLEQGKLASLDTPVHTFYPEWNQGRKKAITVRHLLNHTSGLQNVGNAGIEIYPAPNAIQLALAAELTADPGTEFSYNNKAVNLLAGIIERASGLRMDLFFQDQFFGPLGIEEYQWYFDRSGSPHAMAGLRLKAADVAKFGLLVLDRGRWKGQQLIGESFLAEMTRPSQPHYPLVGLLWWIEPDTQQVTLRTESIRTRPRGSLFHRLAPLAGQTFPTRPAARAAALATVGQTDDSLFVREAGPRWVDSVFAWRVGAPLAYHANGYLGQYLVVVPAARLVAVRQIRNSDGYDPKTDGFEDFPARVARMARAGGAIK